MIAITARPSGSANGRSFAGIAAEYIDGSRGAEL
jgi:hypothetical protein